MASKDNVMAMMAAMATNYNKRNDWADAVWGTWFTALKPYSDDDVRRVARQVMAERGRVPTVAAFLECMKADPRTEKPKGAAGCAACVGSGWREVVWHRWSEKRLLVTSYAAGCDCDKGRGFCMGAARHWADVVNEMRNDGSTEAVYATSAAKPTLTLDERYHPDTVARLRGTRETPQPGG
jgi:hypothetical protein